MTIVEALIAYLKGCTGLTALIGTRLHRFSLPQGTPLPAVVLLDVSDVKRHSLAGQMTLEQPIKQFTVHAASESAAAAVVEQLKAALNDFQGTMSGLTIQKIELQTEGADWATSPDGTDSDYLHDLEYEVSYVRE